MERPKDVTLVKCDIPSPVSPPLTNGELDYLFGLCDLTDDTVKREPGLHQIHIDSYVLRSLITEVKQHRNVEPPRKDEGLGASPSTEGDRAFVLRTEPPSASPPFGLQSLAQISDEQLADLERSCYTHKQQDGGRQVGVHSLVLTAVVLHALVVELNEKRKASLTNCRCVVFSDLPNEQAQNVVRGVNDFDVPGAVGRDPLRHAWRPIKGT